MMIQRCIRLIGEPLEKVIKQPINWLMIKQLNMETFNNAIMQLFQPAS